MRGKLVCFILLIGMAGSGCRAASVIQKQPAGSVKSNFTAYASNRYYLNPDIIFNQPANFKWQEGILPGEKSAIFYQSLNWDNLKMAGMYFNVIKAVKFKNKNPKDVFQAINDVLIGHMSYCYIPGEKFKDDLTAIFFNNLQTTKEDIFSKKYGANEYLICRKSLHDDNFAVYEMQLAYLIKNNYAYCFALLVPSPMKPQEQALFELWLQDLQFSDSKSQQLKSQPKN